VSADQEAVKAGAVAQLCTALTNAAGVCEALRSCWYRNPIFSSTLCTEAVRQHFGEAPDIRAITRFVSRIRPGEPGFPRREAEAVIRAALGETAFFECVHPRQFSYPEMGIAVLDRLFLEWRPRSSEIECLFRRLEKLLEVVREMCPELALGEDDWFAARMHESPFVLSIGEGPVQRDGGR
jgi:hypothetical protein